MSIALSVRSEDSLAAYESRIPDILAVTQEMFEGDPTIEISRDPEDPEHPFFVVTVHWRGEARAMVDQRLAWHERISKLHSGGVGVFRLSVIPA